MQTQLRFDFQDETFAASLTIPEGNEPAPAIILIHEIWGLNDHTKDVANRLSDEGFLVLAPDLLEGTGIEEKIDHSILKDLHDPEKRDEAQKKMREVTTPIRSKEFGEATLEICFEFLHNHERSSGKIAVVGFCFGGSYAFSFATRQPNLKAVVPFYGHAPTDPNLIENIQSPILAFYGGKDERLMEQLPDLQKMMDEYHKDFEAKIYPDCGHAFFNDTNPTTYHKAAAEDAWLKMLTFLKKNLA